MWKSKMAYENKPKLSLRCPKLFYGLTKMFINSIIAQKRHGRWCISHWWHCIVLFAKLASSTLSRCWLEIIRAATNKPKHHNICTHQHQHHQHNCRVIPTSAPPLLRPVLLLGRSSGVTIARVFCWSHLGAILITRERIIILVLVSSSCCCSQGCGVWAGTMCCSCYYLLARYKLYWQS